MIPIQQSLSKGTTQNKVTSSKALLLSKTLSSAEHMIEKGKVLSKDHPDGIQSHFNIGCARTLCRYLIRLESDMSIEIFEDRASSGLPFQIVC